jgi:hypothetical protein
MACKRSAVRSCLSPPISKRLQFTLEFCTEIKFKSRSSRGLGHDPFTVVTGVRLPYGTPIRKALARKCGGFLFGGA